MKYLLIWYGRGKNAHIIGPGVVIVHSSCLLLFQGYGFPTRPLRLLFFCCMRFNSSCHQQCCMTTAILGVLFFHDTQRSLLSKHCTTTNLGVFSFSILIYLVTLVVDFWEFFKNLHTEELEVGGVLVGSQQVGRPDSIPGSNRWGTLMLGTLWFHCQKCFRLPMFPLPQRVHQQPKEEILPILGAHWQWCCYREDTQWGGQGGLSVPFGWSLPRPGSKNISRTELDFSKGAAVMFLS